MCTIVGDTLADYTDDVGGRVHDVSFDPALAGE